MPEPQVRDFRDIQYQFTAHMRDPERNPAPADVEDRRLGIYRDLLYRNVEGFLANSFPVLRSLMADDNWHTLVRHYFATHQSRTPLFPKMPQEFLHYLAADNYPCRDLPFIQELAHYEWLELEVSLDNREIDASACDDGIDCMDGVPVVNPVARMHAYQYPVHEISPQVRPSQPGDQPTYLIVYRDRNDTVGFMQLNPITARLLDLMSESANRTGRQCLQLIAEELSHPDPDVVVSGGAEVLTTLTAKDVVLGARRKSR